MNDSTRVTVFIPAHNAEAYLGDAIESVLNQTYQDFWLLVIDDGSDDGTPGIAEGFARQDTRVSVIRRENRGRPATRNQGLALARGDYLAFLDADDICLPDRLANQVRFLDSHPDVGAVGTAYRELGGGRRVVVYPDDSEDIACALCIDSALANPSAMVRMAVIREHQIIYDSRDLLAQDYRFWTRLARHTRLANLREVQLFYRHHESQGSQTHAKLACETANHISRDALYDYGVTLSEDEVILLRYAANVRAQIIEHNQRNLENSCDVLIWTASRLVAAHSFSKYPVSRVFIARMINYGLPATIWSVAIVIRKLTRYVIVLGITTVWSAMWSMFRRVAWRTYMKLTTSEYPTRNYSS